VSGPAGREGAEPNPFDCPSPSRYSAMRRSRRRGAGRRRAAGRGSWARRLCAMCGGLGSSMLT